MGPEESVREKRKEGGEWEWRVEVKRRRKRKSQEGCLTSLAFFRRKEVPKSLSFFIIIFQEPKKSKMTESGRVFLCTSEK